jgi:signal transduction histidine kinase
VSLAVLEKSLLSGALIIGVVVLGLTVAQVTCRRALRSLDTTGMSASVQVVVADTGAPPDMLPRILDAFYSTKSEGLGVGLFASQSLVRQHGGRIAVASRLGGSAFIVWLSA